MFSNFGAKKKHPFRNLKTVTIAVIIHALLIGAAVYVSAKEKKKKKKEEKKEMVTYVKVKPKPKPKPEPKPKPKPEPKQPEPKPKPKPEPKPQGFQTLETPVDISSDIPAVDLTANPVSAEDFSGLGVVGGRGEGKGGGDDSVIESLDVFAAVQHMPELLNKKEFYGNVEYPRGCRLAGIEGTVYVSFVVTGTGDVINAKVIRGIGGGCDEYALQYIVENAKFSPGKQRGQPVAVKFTLPITFRLR